MLKIDGIVLILPWEIKSVWIEFQSLETMIKSQTYVYLTIWQAAAASGAAAYNLAGCGAKLSDGGQPPSIKGATGLTQRGCVPNQWGQLLHPYASLRLSMKPQYILRTDLSLYQVYQVSETCIKGWQQMLGQIFS